MVAAKHTPGPWAIEQPWSGFSSIKGGDGKLVFGIAAGAPDEKRPDSECEANARLIAAAPDLDAAAGLAITALAFEQEKAIEREDPIAYAQITGAKNALIAAQDKVRGRNTLPEMLDITPRRAAITKATGAA